MIRRHYCWIIAVLVAVVSVLSGGTLEGQGTPSDTLQVQDVTSQEVFDLIQENHGNPDFIILDVRTSLEFHNGHIEGALNIDGNLPSFSEELEQLDRNDTYLVYCRSGNRSMTALGIMEGLEFTRIYHLTNGISEWVDAGLPVSQ
jgi:rhodanese-related sulfurtransferase